ncbi:ComEA family DNA-binding protein [Fodinibius halophilus]|uniref:Helix-hairpin-helix domain-containing protein n=1 Tax=Fodinibius halophilus TaxID=1736908 RepID=A0A6M1TEL6_9BACT|nr:helix-hairpin-helix domain-containing protein [Fodinibius halophilus]NGP88622.1 helix-hairpin-helix domain-containing protein [Fodinibius halophilus]
MKRKIFFWLEKLKITPGERITISGLLILLVVLAIINFGISKPEPFEERRYHELEQQFDKRTNMLEKQREKVLSKYNPPKRQRHIMADMDTLPTDTIDPAPENKAGSDSTNHRININVASQVQLESLPGIGPTYAKRIIKYRQEHGKFDAITELKKIKGIAQKRLDKLKPFIKLKDPN